MHVSSINTNFTSMTRLRFCSKLIHQLQDKEIFAKSDQGLVIVAQAGIMAILRGDI